MKRKTLYLIIGICAAIFVIAFCIGFFMGYSVTLGVMVKEASKFVHIDESLIREYLARVGL